LLAYFYCSQHQITCPPAGNKRFAAMLARQLYFNFTLLSSLASA
jgi:hypothetical protein